MCQDHPRSVTSTAVIVWSGDLDTVNHAMCCHDWFILTAMAYITGYEYRASRDSDKPNSPTDSNGLLLAGGELSDDELEVSVHQNVSIQVELIPYYI